MLNILVEVGASISTSEILQCGRTNLQLSALAPQIIMYRVMEVINLNTPITYTLAVCSADQVVQQPFAEGDHGPDSITELRLYDGEVRRAFLQLGLPRGHLCLQICSLSEAQ